VASSGGVSSLGKGERKAQEKRGDRKDSIVTRTGKEIKGLKGRTRITDPLVILGGLEGEGG